MQDFNIALGGLTSCGKTSYGKRLATHFGMTRKSASEILLNLSQELGYHSYEEGEDKHHYRLREKARILNEIRKENQQLDKMVDEKVVDLLINTKGTIIETLTAPLLLSNDASNVLKIYFDVSLNTRAKRAYISSDTISLDELKNKVYEKDVISRTLIKDLRGFDIFDRKLLYDNNHIVVDNSEFDEFDNKEIMKGEKAQNLELLVSCVLVAKKEMWGYNVSNQEYDKAKDTLQKYSKLIKKMQFLPVSVAHE